MCDKSNYYMWMQKRHELEEQSSMLYWWPKIKNLAIPKPRTIIVPFKDISSDFEKIKQAARVIGYPIFLRTDHTSGKHHYERTCYVPDEDSLLLHVNELIEYSDTAGLLGLPLNALIVREFIELDWRFKAFYGLPIAPEYRFIIRNGKVEQFFPYWPEDAIMFYGRYYRQHDMQWREKLHQMYEDTKGDLGLLSNYALEVAKVMLGYWSVDFAKARNGKWYLIDMARGELSWTPARDTSKEVKENE